MILPFSFLSTLCLRKPISPPFASFTCRTLMKMWFSLDQLIALTHVHLIT